MPTTLLPIRSKHVSARLLCSLIALLAVAQQVPEASAQQPGDRYAQTPPSDAASPQLPVPADQPLPATQPPQAENGRYQLQHLNVDQLHARLQNALGHDLPLLAEGETPWVRFVIEKPNSNQPKSAPLVFSGNRETGELRLAGRPDQLRAWNTILAALDQPAEPAAKTELVATNGKDDAKIRQVVNLLVAQNTQVGPADARAAAADPNDPFPVEGNVEGNVEAVPGVNPAAMQSALGSLLGPVQVEFVEGTNYLILRGKPEDVARVEMIISQLEALSQVSEPTTTVFSLKHIDSTAIARLVQLAFDPDASATPLSDVYGSLSVVPLVKPNAVLLIGQPLPVEKATELIEKLDQPGESLTQFEVIRLKHADAARAVEVIEGVFQVEDDEETATLTPQAVVYANQRTNAVIVRASPRDMAEVKAIIAEIDRPGGESESELQIFKLTNSVATDLVPVLRETLLGNAEADGSEAAQRAAALLRLIVDDEGGRRQLESGVLSQARITADQRANAVVVTAPKDAMPLIAALIGELDQSPDTTAELKVFTIKNGDAVSLSEMLEGLFSAAGNQGGQDDGDGRTPFQLRFSVDERTNSIIAAGSRDELVLVEAILLRLDSSDMRERVNQVYKLKNADAEQVALALQEWIEARREVQETAPGVVSPFQQIEREVVVVPEINSNSLIVSAAPEYFEELERIIEQLDEQAPMVMIQVLIGEIRLGDADEFGIEFGLQDSLLYDRSLLEDIQQSTNTTITNDPGGGSTTFSQQVINSARFTPGFGFGDPNLALGNSGSSSSMATAGRVAAQGLSSFAVGRVNPDLGFGGLVLSASSESVSMLLRALQESRRLEVLSRPQIMALDNQTGRAFVGESVPIITASNIDQFGRQNNTVAQVDVGLLLLVRPRISPDGLVVMEVVAEKNELGPISQGIPIAVAPNGDPIRVPRINKTEAETTISAVSGQTVVLSGLLTKRDSALHRRVPLLADIPLLGDMFRFDSTSTTRSELLIILTPHVVRNRYEAEMLKQVESARMSWCLSDVVEMNGATGLRSRGDMMGAAEAETVYPSEMAPGDKPLATQPELAPLANPEQVLPQPSRN